MVFRVAGFCFDDQLYQKSMFASLDLVKVKVFRPLKKIEKR